MARRSESFDEFVAEKMKDPKFARQTLLTSIEEFDESIEEALKYTIEQMGIKEFSDLSGIRIQNISEFIKGKRNLKLETLDKYLAVFDLKSKVIVVIPYYLTVKSGKLYLATFPGKVLNSSGEWVTAPNRQGKVYIFKALNSLATSGLSNARVSRAPARAVRSRVRAVRGPLVKPTKPESPIGARQHGLFKFKNGVYIGFSGSYCKYGSVQQLDRIYGKNWRGKVKAVSNFPVKMINGGYCKGDQGIHKFGNAIAYRFRNGQTCRFSSMKQVKELTGYTSLSVTHTPRRSFLKV